MTKEQVWKLLDYLREDRLFPLYVVYLGCGLRRGEALALTLDCVDLERGDIRVEKTLQAIAGEGLVVGEPKSESSRRVVAMPDFVKSALEDHLINRGGRIRFRFLHLKRHAFLTEKYRRAF